MKSREGQFDSSVTRP
nr:unnamed protein product [Callosobruchus chinensis]